MQSLKIKLNQSCESSLVQRNSFLRVIQIILDIQEDSGEHCETCGLGYMQIMMFYHNHQESERVHPAER